MSSERGEMRYENDEDDLSRGKEKNFVGWWTEKNKENLIPTKLLTLKVLNSFYKIKPSKGNSNA